MRIIFVTIFVCVLVCTCCRMIQVERESADLRSDEIESRVNSGSMDGLNVTLRPRALPTSATAQSLASSTSPPNSGHSTPKHHARSTSHHLGIMTLVRKHKPQSHMHANSILLVCFLCDMCAVVFLTAKRPEETPQESSSKFANPSRTALLFLPGCGFCDWICASSSLPWKWTRPLSSVRRRPPLHLAVYG